ncbi:MAG: glucan biosynthesis protein [Verrucomicrobiota bacterium]
MASEIASKELPAPKPDLPRNLEDIDYDSYRSIRFRPSQALWWNEPSKFRVEFFHMGKLYNRSVNINEITDTHHQKIPFMQENFNYEKSTYKPNFFSKPRGYAGIRVLYPLHKSDIYDEVLVFLGASYFRALGATQVWGLSGRALTQNTINGRERFPFFREFWLKKPDLDSNQLTILALLHGENVSGAYEFTLSPGETTTIDVLAQIYFWKGAGSRAGFAPLTSMFYFGENTIDKPADWRPEVHDSDGLLIHESNSWIWRPLSNPAQPVVNQFKVKELHGFGLMQRDRLFKNYEDLEAEYHHRPSAWVTPGEVWPEGSVILYTFPTTNEIVDNVNAFWTPEQAPASKKPYRIQYTVEMRKTDPESDLARILDTHIGSKTLEEETTSFVIDIERISQGSAINISSYTVDFEASGATVITTPRIIFNEPENCFRVLIDLKSPKIEDSSKLNGFDLALKLKKDAKPYSETWSYTWTP